MYTPNPKQIKQVENNFTYHPSKDGQQKRYQRIREYAQTMGSILITNCPESRELSLALTHVEDAVMWANAAIARNE